MKKRVNTILISGIVVFMLTSFIFFIATNERELVTWVSFCFLLLTEIILFGGLILIEYLATKVSPIVMRAGFGSSLVICSIISMIVSMFYIVSENESVKPILIIQAILLAIIIILFFVFYTTSGSVKVSSDKVINTTIRISSFIDKLNSLSKDGNNDKYKKQLTKIAQDLSFSDISTSVSCDSEIERKLASLELTLLKEDESKDTEISKLLEDMVLLINKRKFEIKNTKVGGI
jgi:hypothetical protein